MKVKKFLEKIIAFSMGLCMITGLSEVYADESMNLVAEAKNEENYVSLNWNAPSAFGRYSYIIYSKESKEAEFQSIPSKCNVKVLNIYPAKGNNFKSWMESPNSDSPNGYGKGLISVDEVNIIDFNANPEPYLKDSDGNWKYDVIYQGAWDTNNSLNLGPKAKILVEEYIKSGRGYLGGHDTIGYSWGISGLSGLREYFNIKTGTWNHSSPNYTDYKYDTVGFKAKEVTIKKKGLLTNYPWNIGDVGTTLGIPTSHSTSNFAEGDIWMAFPDNAYYSNQTADLPDELKEQANFYLTTWNNTAMIQTGHSNGEATTDEQKVLANTVFYLSQITEDTSWDDHKGQDLDAPTIPIINSVAYDETNRNVTIDYAPSIDNGTTYDYYVEATNLETEDKTKSETKSATVITGLKGYSIVVDNKADTIPSGDITTTETNAKVSLNGVEDKEFYVHVAAVDKAGNISEVSHYKYGSSEVSDIKVILDIEPEKDKIYVENEVNAYLTIDNIEEIAAEDVRIKYDSSKLQLLKVEEVSGIKLVKDEKNEGELRVILASKGANNIVFGKKALLKLQFKGLEEGQALIDVTKGRVSDGIDMEKDLLDSQCEQAIITIEKFKDVNMDAVFTLLDLAIYGRCYGLNPLDFPKYITDIVVNGLIDDEDLLQIGRYILENPNYNF